MQRPGVVLLDVRRPDEFAMGHLPGARNLDYLGEPFIDELEQLDPDKTYLVYCNSGRRSLRTCVLMKNGGFRHVFNLDGGLRGWLASDHPPELEK
ncbi:MAG: rhodanese-like domain-containing protein [Bacteroidetes bacterium]|nr:MAG: rhodanese-like domain-containing protein [Bacteroidota bacterium]